MILDFDFKQEAAGAWGSESQVQSLWAHFLDVIQQNPKNDSNKDLIGKAQKFKESHSSKTVSRDKLLESLLNKH